ncbi:MULTISPECIES: protease Lon-related BREX system protein BrxL [Methanosarcina]|uniref:Putative ATP-dependent protease n=1 Tax=Methanosarcina vacuolata Z-761 TaxID=1434123 RepID=A0A0E3Q3K4_9EURY|nr:MULTISPECIES: protease Lon-related BREX system protein BrxL [Methanosarcina]AKB43062.1 putative ATP-dependent protease [Methanosarcina vacuolata Z-761]AKB46543.1 putative ATP-dependent protease [Methanosarcina sp. Kolksee]MDW5549132.1 protease Lon-related BREX system protein BrxL [Methanosarcina sp.]MDW5549161.1 protease Lon-related BREX system protein BrxL [Methanosarcina sp.]MDW5553133.1 protease Lon-related BREX system protein BrxL [Methanosarcina sp.]
MSELDQIDRLAASSLDGYLVRKDLVRTFSRQFPVPTYVVEFLLGRYCASIDNDEIEEGLEIVQRQLNSRTVKAGEEELFKSRARENGEVKIIDLITARLDAKTDSYVATLPSLQLTDVRISSELVNEHERMLTGGFYAEISLNYDAAIAQESKGRPFGVESLREIQLSKRDVLNVMAEARKKFTTEEWKAFLLRSIGIEPTALSERVKNAFLLRMVPFVERNYNLVELGPRGTGKSHLFQQISPYAHLISGGKATVARMFVNNSTGQRGLVCQYDVVCFDEISGISFDQKDGVNIMKGYMESGEFSRGKESIRADGSMVLVGNFEVDVEHQQHVSHLFGPMPPEIRDDTAFMDRIHAYLPGWDVPKINKELLTDHFGLVSDFLSECWSQLRNQSRVSLLQNRVFYGGALSGRDTNAVNKTVSGLLKLLYPGDTTEIPEEELEWAVRIAMEARRRVKEQQKRIGAAEFRNTHFSYVMGEDGIEKFVSTPELQSENSIGGDPLEPGQVWAISPGSIDEHPGLYRIEVNEGPGSGVKILNKPVPQAFRESVNYAEQNLYSRFMQLVGDKDPRHHEFTVQLRAFDVSKSGAKLGMPSLVALCTSLLRRSVRGGLIIVGEIALGGSIEPIHNPVTIAEIAVEKGATALLMPVSCRRQLFDLSDDMATKIDIQFYSDVRDALVKAMVD